MSERVGVQNPAYYILCTYVCVMVIPFTHFNSLFLLKVINIGKLAPDSLFYCVSNGMALFVDNMRFCAVFFHFVCCLINYFYFCEIMLNALI